MKQIKGKKKKAGDNITLRSDGRYQARYTDRFGKRRTIYSRDKAKLKEKLIEAQFKNNNCLNVIDEKITLDEWYAKWMAIYKAPYIRANTKRHYKQIYTKHISPSLGRMRMDKIGKIHVQSLINFLHETGLQWETQNKVRVLLKDMYECAIADQVAVRNPCLGVKCVAKKPDNEPRFLTKEEQALFFECCAGRWYDNMFHVAVNTGLRPGELAALTWDDIDITNMLIHVEKTLVYQKFEGDDKKTYHLEDCKTDKGRRTVPINDECLKHLKRQYVQKNILSRKTSGDTIFTDCLFVTRRNNPVNATDYTGAIRQILRDINEMLDPLEQIEPFSGHAFRHTFATRCIESGIRPKTLQAMLGHSSVKSTMDMYVHVDDDAKKEQMGKLVNQFTPEGHDKKVYEKELKLVNFR